MEQNLLNEIFLPNEVWTRIISYLGVADVRSCRLVCRQWRTCCEEKIFTKAEKFVFHSAAQLPSEINQFLMNLERDRINVQLNRIDLRELNFNAFGDKIEELEMINCLTDEDTLKNFFYLTPNMTRLQVRLIVHRFPHEILPTDSEDFDAWNAVMKLLHEQKFQHHNLKDFDCNLYQLERILVHVVHGNTPQCICNLGDTFLSHVFFVFPCLRNIHFGDERWLCNKRTMQNLLPKPDLTNFGGIFEISFDRDHLETFASLFPRLKSLQLAVYISDWKCSPLSLCDKFFSLLTELESLNLEYAVRVPLQTEQGKVIKALLFQILKSCSKLSQLGLTPRPAIKTDIRLSRGEVQEFFSLITKIKSFRIPKIFVELESGETMVALPNTHGVLKDLRFPAESIQGKPSDLRCMLMKTYQLTTLCLHIGGNPLSVNFETILQSQKCLRHLTFITTIKMSEMPTLQMKSNDGIQSKHERLNYLHYVFMPTEENYPIDYFLERLCLWEFPNLLHLSVSSGAGINCIRQRWLQTATPKLENTFKDWVGRMTTLTHINVHIRAGLLNFQEFVHVCKKLPRLQSILWTGREQNEPQKADVINLFDNLPSLKSMSYHKRHESFQYSRSKKQLFHVRPNPRIKGMDLILVD